MNSRTRYRPRLESLEDRVSPAILAINSPVFTGLTPTTPVQSNFAPQPLAASTLAFNQTGSQDTTSGLLTQRSTLDSTAAQGVQMFAFTNGPSNPTLSGPFSNDPSLAPLGTAIGLNTFPGTPVFNLQGAQAQLLNNQMLTRILSESSDTPGFQLLPLLNNPASAQGVTMIGSLIPSMAANPPVGMRILPTSLRSLTPSSTPDAVSNISPNLTRLQLLQPGENGTNATAHIVGTVAQDGFTRDGVLGVRVQLEMLQDGRFVPASATTTDVAGNFTFSSLGPGTYRVRLVVPDGRQLDGEGTAVLQLHGTTREADVNFRLRLERSPGRPTAPEQPRPQPEQRSEPSPQAALTPEAATDLAFALDWAVSESPVRYSGAQPNAAATGQDLRPVLRAEPAPASGRSSDEGRGEPTAAESLVISGLLLAQLQVTPRGVDGRQKKEPAQR